MFNGKIPKGDLIAIDSTRSVTHGAKRFMKSVLDGLVAHTDLRIVLFSDNKNFDSYKTGELCLKAMDLAQKILHKDGVFLSKLFMGSIFVEIHEKANKYFKKVIKYKPLSSRQESKEVYIYCKGISKV